MARLARAVVPGMPHHVTQRGNRRMEVFFSDADYQAYPSLMAQWCGLCLREALTTRLRSPSR